MNKIISLSKVLLKGFGISQEPEVNKKKKINPIIYIVLVIYLCGVFGFLSFNLVTELDKINQSTLFLNLLLTSMSVTVIFVSIFSCINVFYFSKDIEHILPMPFKPKEILISKFISLLVYVYFIEAIFMLPGIAIYGIMLNMTFLYYIYSAVVVVLLPIVPLIIATLIIMVIMCFSRLTKYKERFHLITGLIAILLAVGIQVGMNAISSQNGDIDIQVLVDKSESIVSTANNYFITIQMASDALINCNKLEGLTSIALLFLITIGVFYLFTLIGEKLYFKGLSGNMENASSSKRKKNINISYEKSSILKVYVSKELKLLFRNPVYFLQCVLPAFAIPIIFGVIFLVNESFMKDVGMYFASIPSLTKILGTLIAVQFIGMMNFCSVTAISREGGGATYNKVLPISLYKQVVAKIIPGIILSTVSLITTLAIAPFIIPLNIADLVIIFVIGMLLNIVQNYMFIYIDLKRPKLVWESEYAVVKQNLNMLFEMIISMGFLIILGVLIVVSDKLSIYWTVILITISLSLLWKVVDLFYQKNTDRLFDNVQ